jgi:arylsulfatase
MKITISLLNYLFIFLLTLSAVNSDAKNIKPNIIFILADDMSYRDLSCYGQQRYKTPNLDALAEGSVRFTQAYSAAPECAPSRCGLMTGLHTGHSSVRANSSARGQDYIPDSDLTIAEVLKTAGYNTAFTGKWGIGQQETEGVPYKQGFDYTFGYYDQAVAHTYIPYYLYENDKKIEYPENQGFNMDARYEQKTKGPANTYDKNGKLYINELKDPYGYTYSANEIEKKTMQFLEKNNSTKTDKPFFLYYATTLPHGPVIVDEMGEMMQPDSVSQIVREWAAMVIKLDKFVGKLVAHLKQTGEYENTIIFFASDNGYTMHGAPDYLDDPWSRSKGPFKAGKFTLYEGGIRVPFFVSWPAKFKPAVYSQPVWLPDFFPTAVELAGLKTEKYKTDGLSLMPLFQGEPEKYKGHESMYFSRGREQAVRMGPWKAHRNQPGDKTTLHLVEEDTYTERDLSAIYPDVVKRAEKIMDTSYTIHPWYWNPNETKNEFKAKQQKAIETNNILPVYRPNDVKKFSWE